MYRPTIAVGSDIARRFTSEDVVPLRADARPLLEEHLLALSGDDRRLRFGASLSSAAIGAYVVGIDFDQDTVSGIFDDRGVLIGVTHLGVGDDCAELGISVLTDARGRGAGQALFAAAAANARVLRVPRLLMHCLAENAAMMHIARKAGMDVVVAAGEADAYLELAVAKPNRWARLRSLRRSIPARLT